LTNLAKWLTRSLLIAAVPRAFVGRMMLKNKLGERVHLAVSGELVNADDRICLGPLSSPPIRRSSGH